MPWLDLAGTFHEDGRSGDCPRSDRSGWGESTLTRRQQNPADYGRNGPAPVIVPID